MSEDKTLIGGPVEPATTSTVIDFNQFKKNKAEGKLPVTEGKQWPGAVPTVSEPVTVTAEDPNQRRILLSLAHGDIIVDGHLGLSQTFLAVGDSNGRIKFAAAPGMWLYARDMTDDAVEPTTAA